ncbi:hypothetical protein FQN57_005738 [Myotisia sp. PD_48]|nr:hypothetical protein FQN57_005738 [Myotisia sp. PD_48]
MHPLNSFVSLPTVSTLYKTQYLDAAAASSATPRQTNTPSQHLNDTICHITYDITKLEVDCIVNAANQSLLGGGGVDGAIHRAAGPNLHRECRSLGGCPTGDAKITDGYQLPCRKVIHAVGPVYSMEKIRGGVERAEALLGGCYRRSLELATQSRMKSIAFSSLSTGVYGYPSIDAANVALRTVREFLESSASSSILEKVVFCTFEEKDVRAYKTLLPVYFPPTEANLSTSQLDSRKRDESNAQGSHSPEAIAASLPNAPTSDPITKEETLPGPKRAKLSPDNSTIVAKEDDDKSEDDWEKVEQPKTGGRASRNGNERLDDEPVEVANAPTAADVRSVSSVADLESSQEKLK